MFNLIVFFSLRNRSQNSFEGKALRMKSVVRVVAKKSFRYFLQYYTVFRVE